MSRDQDLKSRAAALRSKLSGAPKAPPKTTGGRPGTAKRKSGSSSIRDTLGKGGRPGPKFGIPKRGDLKPFSGPKGGSGAKSATRSAKDEIAHRKANQSKTASQVKELNARIAKLRASGKNPEKLAQLVTIARKRRAKLVRRQKRTRRAVVKNKRGRGKKPGINTDPPMAT